MRASLWFSVRATAVVLGLGAPGVAPAAPPGAPVPAVGYPPPAVPVNFPEPLAEGFATQPGPGGIVLPVSTPAPGAVPDAQPPMGGAATGGGNTGTSTPRAAPPAAGQNAPIDPFKMTARWNTPNPGVWIETADKNFVFHAGGTVHYDAAFYTASPLLELGRGGTGKFNDGANMRRARIFFEGTLYHQVDYKFELEFQNGVGVSPAGTTGPVTNTSVINSPGPTDAWITVKEIPLFGNVRVGSQKEWFSLEHLNNYRALEFMERSVLFDLAQATRFNNGFTPGISVYNTWLDQRAFTAAGVYKNESDLIGFGLGDGNYAFTGRVAALPVWRPDDQMWWHVGGGMSHRDPVNGQVVVSVRDNVRNAPLPLLNLLINTGAINASSQDLYNLETAAVWGPFTVQAEYTANLLHSASVAVTGTTPAGRPQGTLFFGGCYAEVMWLLTGESRTFNRGIFALNRVVPKRPLWFKRGDECDDGRGFGAVELAARYSYLDVSNKAVQAGRLDTYTLGLNWYLNTAAKLQFNYDYTRRGLVALSLLTEPHRHVPRPHAPVSQPHTALDARNSIAHQKALKISYFERIDAFLTRRHARCF